MSLVTWIVLRIFFTHGDRVVVLLLHAFLSTWEFFPWEIRVSFPEDGVTLPRPTWFLTSVSFVSTEFLPRQSCFVVVVCIRGGVAQWLRASQLKSEDPGFDPLERQGERGFLSLRVPSCAVLFVPDPPPPPPLSCVPGTHPKCVRTLNILYSYVVKSRPHSRWYDHTHTHTNTAYTRLVIN